MAKKYKLAVSDTVQVTVKVTLADSKGKLVNHKFMLTCERRGAEEMKELMSGSFNAKEFMKEVTTGWEGQNLVLEDDGIAAAFEKDAMDALLDISGMAMVCFVAYGKDAAAQAKN
jgi:hypothetical protein